MPDLRELTCRRWAEREPALDTAAMEIVSRIKRIAIELERATEDIYADAELSAAEVELLVPLRHSDEPLTAIRLAEHLHMSRAGVSKTLAKLENRGLLTRTTHPEDRRAAVVALTASGIAAIDAVFPRELAAHTRALAGLGEDRAGLLAELDRLSHALHTARVST